MSAATRPIPAAVSSTIPGRSGIGGAYFDVSVVACATSSRRWCTDCPVGTRPPQDSRLANTALRYRNSPAIMAAKQRIAGIARRRAAAPMAAATMTAPAPAQNHMPPANSGYRAIDVSTVAVAAATVNRMFMGWPSPGCPRLLSGLWGNQPARPRPRTSTQFRRAITATIARRMTRNMAASLDVVPA